MKPKCKRNDNGQTCIRTKLNIHKSVLKAFRKGNQLNNNRQWRWSTDIEKNDQALLCSVFTVHCTLISIKIKIKKETRRRKKKEWRRTPNRWLMEWNMGNGRAQLIFLVWILALLAFLAWLFWLKKWNNQPGKSHDYWNEKYVKTNQFLVGHFPSLAELGIGARLLSSMRMRFVSFFVLVLGSYYCYGWLLVVGCWPFRCRFFFFFMNIVNGVFFSFSFPFLSLIYGLCVMHLFILYFITWNARTQQYTYIDIPWPVYISFSFTFAQTLDEIESIETRDEKRSEEKKMKQVFL